MVLSNKPEILLNSERIIFPGVGAYADAMDKLQKMNSENLTIEEQKYYIEVMARIEKKLLEASQ